MHSTPLVHEHFQDGRPRRIFVWLACGRSAGAERNERRVARCCGGMPAVVTGSYGTVVDRRKFSISTKTKSQPDLLWHRSSPSPIEVLEPAPGSRRSRMRYTSTTKGVQA
jgi:hypothetical protein